jgi:hypothetical protein
MKCTQGRKVLVDEKYSLTSTKPSEWSPGELNDEGATAYWGTRAQTITPNPFWVVTWV